MADKPDGWYLPNNRNEVAVILETKGSSVALKQPQVEEILKNVRIAQSRYEKVVGILYNGEEVRIFKGDEEVQAADRLQRVGYYLSLWC